MKEELCEMMNVRWVSDCVITVVLGCEGDVLRLICGYTLES